MRSFITHLLLTASLLGLLPGCSVMPTGDVPVTTDADQLPSGHRGIQLDPQLIPNYQDVQSQLEAFQLANTTRPLTAAECACLAVSRCQLAAVLDKEAADLRRQVATHRRRSPSRLLPGIVSDQAAKERNDAAQQALLAYYQLAEIHLQNALLGESYAELDRLEQTVAGLFRGGIPVEMDRTELDRQRLQLHFRNAELHVNEARLTTQVKALIVEDPFSPETIETDCAIEPRPVGYELHDAMEIARRNDFQLKSIRRMLHQGDTEDLDVARELLQVASPLLGQAPVKLGFLAKISMAIGHDDRDEVELRLRKQQLRDLYQVRQQQLDLEVAHAVVSVQEQFLAVGIAKDVFDSWHQRLVGLETQRQLQKSSYLDTVTARTERLKAKSELIHKLIQLEILHARLRGIMGLLGQECGAEGVPAQDWQWSPLHGPCRVGGLTRDQLR